MNTRIYQFFMAFRNDRVFLIWCNLFLSPLSHTPPSLSHTSLSLFLSLLISFFKKLYGLLLISFHWLKAHRYKFRTCFLALIGPRIRLPFPQPTSSLEFLVSIVSYWCASLRVSFILSRNSLTLVLTCERVCMHFSLQDQIYVKRAIWY